MNSQNLLYRITVLFVVLGSLGFITPSTHNLLSVSAQSDSPVFSDDFSTDPNTNGHWHIHRYASDTVNEASWDDSNQVLYLTRTAGQRAVALFANHELKATSWEAKFKYKVGGGSGADGFTFMFYKNENAYGVPGRGGFLGFQYYFGGGIPGYGIEFDSRFNPSSDGIGDPSSSHIALIQDRVGNHLSYVNDTRISDSIWHDALIQFDRGHIIVSVDGQAILEHRLASPDYTYSGVGFTSGTGSENNNHIIDDFVFRSMPSGFISESCETSLKFPFPQVFPQWNNPFQQEIPPTRIFGTYVGPIAVYARMTGFVEFQFNGEVCSNARIGSEINLAEPKVVIFIRDDTSEVSFGSNGSVTGEVTGTILQDWKRGTELRFLGTLQSLAYGMRTDSITNKNLLNVTLDRKIGIKTELTYVAAVLVLVVSVIIIEEGAIIFSSAGIASAKDFAISLARDNAKLLLPRLVFSDIDLGRSSRNIRATTQLDDNIMRILRELYGNIIINSASISQLSISKSSAKIGDTIQFSGAGFTPNTNLVIFFGNKDNMFKQDVIVNAQGDINGTLTIPTYVSGGTWTITAFDNKGIYDRLKAFAEGGELDTRTYVQAASLTVPYLVNLPLVQR